MVAIVHAPPPGSLLTAESKAFADWLDEVGAARMGAIRAAPDSAGKEERDLQAENLRKMLLAMVEDIRVVLVKLAERTQALRFLVGSETASAEARAHAARETLDLFAPLANRLGVWQLKWELEDLSLRA